MFAVYLGHDCGLKVPPVQLVMLPVRSASSPEAQDLRGRIKLSHAGSWRGRPGRWDAVRRCPGLSPAFERFDDDHLPATARAWRANIDWIVGRVVNDGHRDAKQLSGTVEMATQWVYRER